MWSLLHKESNRKRKSTGTSKGKVSAFSLLLNSGGAFWHNAEQAGGVLLFSLDLGMCQRAFSFHNRQKFNRQQKLFLSHPPHRKCGVIPQYPSVSYRPGQPLNLNSS
jgi:hypothetical protein